MANDKLLFLRTGSLHLFWNGKSQAKLQLQRITCVLVGLFLENKHFIYVIIVPKDVNFRKKESGNAVSFQTTQD